MSDIFDNLRSATRACIQQLGTSRDQELFEFRNAATYTVVDALLRVHDCLREQVAAPVESYSVGKLTAAEAALLHAYRLADDRSKSTIHIAADIALEKIHEAEIMVRCDVVDIASARLPKF